MGTSRLVTAAGYLVLLVLGAVEGCIGSFQYSRSPAPLIAAVLALVVLVTCLGCGWGFGTVAAALVPAVGWIVAAFVLASARSNGSVIITASTAGEWYLYGGSLACVVGVLGTVLGRALFASLSRPASPPPPPPR